MRNSRFKKCLDHVGTVRSLHTRPTLTVNLWLVPFKYSTFSKLPTLPQLLKCLIPTLGEIPLWGLRNLSRAVVRKFFYERVLHAWQSCGTHVHGHKLKIRPKKVHMKTLSLPGPPAHQSIPHGFIYRLSSIQPHRVPSFLFHAHCGSPSLPSCVVYPSRARHSLISFPLACNGTRGSVIG